MSSSVLTSFLARKRLATNQTERRQLEPICNALQAHQNKLALRLCAKMQEKSPEHHIAKALKAVCLFRLAKYQEALTVCDELSANTAALADADVLLFVGWIYMEVGRDADVLEMLDEATRLHGADEDVGIEAFCHFVRVGETKRMQQLSLKMYKSLEQPRLSQLSPLPKPSATLTVPPPKYLYWCLMAIVLQALAQPPLHPTANLLSSLGARLINSARALIGAKEMALGDTAQEFFIRTRLIAVRARGWKPPLPLGIAPPPTTTPLPSGSSDADYARAELLNAFVGPDGNKWCDKYLGLELWRREQEWEIGGEHEWERGRGRCAKLLREGDTNWSTILYLIRFTLKTYHARRIRAALKQTNGATSSPLTQRHLSSSSEESASTEAEESDVESLAPTEVANVVAPADATPVFEPPRSPSPVERSPTVTKARPAPLERSDTPLSATASEVSLPSPGPDMVTELLRWTHDRLYSLAHPPQERALIAKARAAKSKGKGKGKAAEVESDSDEERKQIKAIPKRERGFLLGLLELSRLCRVDNIILQSKNASPMPDLVIDYMGTFGEKQCCFDDLVPYLAVLLPEERDQVRFSDLEAAASRAADDSSTDALYHNITVEKVRRYLTPAIERKPETDVREVARLLAAYFAALPLGKGLPETDLQPADDLAVLSAQASINAWDMSGDLAHLERAVVILEFGLRRSRYKYQMRLLLIRLYILLGAPHLAHAQYEALDPKQIQNDTLSHYFLTRASTFTLAATGDASMLSLTGGSVRWYRLGEAEAADACVRTWSTSTFTKIEEYVDFRERLSHSLNKRLLQIEQVRMRLLQGPLPAAEIRASREILDDIAAKSKELWHDNRDLTILPDYQPADATPTHAVTQPAPLPCTPWSTAFTKLYTSLFSKDEYTAPATSPPELISPVKPTLAHYLRNGDIASPDEIILFRFGEELSSLLATPATVKEAGVQLISAFFDAQEARLEQLGKQSRLLPWNMVHVAQLTLEAYCLLETALVVRRGGISTPSTPTSKKSGAASPKPDVRAIAAANNALLEPARVVLRRIATQLASRADAMKPSAAVARVADLSTFPLLDGFLDEIAMALNEERKSFLHGLSRSIRARLQS